MKNARPPESTMERTLDTITALEFKRLIFELWEHSAEAKIRLRVIGKMWEKNFLQIIHVTAGNSMIVQDNRAAQMKCVSFSEVIQFEIHSKFQAFKPRTHYHVTTL